MQQSTTTTTTEGAWALWRAQCSNRSVYLTCFPHKPLQKLLIMVSCIIVASCIGTHAGPDLVDCGGGSSCLLLLHPSLTCTDPGP